MFMETAVKLTSPDRTAIRLRLRGPPWRLPHAEARFSMISSLAGPSGTRSSPPGAAPLAQKLDACSVSAPANPRLSRAWRIGERPTSPSTDIVLTWMTGRS